MPFSPIGIVDNTFISVIAVIHLFSKSNNKNFIGFKTLPKQATAYKKKLYLIQS